MSETVQDRLHIGRGHELRAAEKMRAHGWHVQDFGQGLLDDDIRQALRNPRLELIVGWRWIPDLIAAKGSRVVLVDPKTDLRKDTPNFSIELQAWNTHRAMRATLGLAIVYVWSDFSCNATELLRPASYLSGVAADRTTFALVRKVDQVPFEQYFGPCQAPEICCSRT